MWYFPRIITSLLDGNIDEYVIKPKQGFIGSSFTLEDKKGNFLGKIKFSDSGHGKNSLFDSNESLVLEFQGKGKGFLKISFDSYEIKNSSKILIGKMRKGSSKNSVLLLENVDGDEILNLKSIPSGSELYQAEKLIAKISVHSHKSFLKKIYEDPESWTLKIHDLSFDKQLLLGFCLSYYHFLRATGGGPGA